MRRPSKDPTTRRTHSYTDVDVESKGNGQLNNSGHDNFSDTSTSFRLMSLLKKQWQNFSDVNFAICQESTDFVIAHKPEFDKEKLKLIKLSSFLETDVLCGTVTAIKTRKIYDGPKLNDHTFSPEWNQDAKVINELISALNRDINRENMFVQGDDFQVESYDMPSTVPATESLFGSSLNSSDEMTQMKIMTTASIEKIRQNPKIVFKSPTHAVVVAVLFFALVGIISTIHFIFF